MEGELAASQIPLVWLNKLEGHLQITCFSLGSFESKWKVALVSLCCQGRNRVKLIA